MAMSWRSGLARTLWSAAKKALLCLGLTGFGLGIIRATQAYTEGREPFLDFSRRAPAAAPLQPETDSAIPQLRFAVATMVSAEATFLAYDQLVQRICRDIGYEQSFVIRPSYADVRQALERGEVDVAFVCTGTYLHSIAAGRIKLLVQPEFQDSREYKCTVIVPSQSPFETLDDLRNASVVFTDPESHTGHVVLRARLGRDGLAPESFFRKTVFTGSHDRSILAVALSAVDAAPVDSLVWRSHLLADPSLAERVRVIWESEAFGPPPIVVPVGIDPAMEVKLRDAFLALDGDDEGRRVLSAIGIERFTLPRLESYKSAEEVFRSVARQEGAAWP